jgi:hypothetical protein
MRLEFDGLEEVGCGRILVLLSLCLIVCVLGLMLHISMSAQTKKMKK